MITTYNVHKLIIGLCFFFILSKEKAYTQVVIGSPSLGFSQACASESFNTYSATFVFSPESALNASNEFSIELSDANGDFSEPTVIFTSNPGEVTSSPATLTFSIPTETAGENYRIRIKSSDPVATSAPSTAFAAYYKLHDTPFTINNLVSTGAFCSGGSYLLTIDNPGTPPNDSPLNYPSLTFNWYKETSPTTSVFVAEGNSLNVDEEGTYFAETNYGSCTSNSFSNRVTISEVNSGVTEAEITSSLGNPFCPEQGMTTLTTIGGDSYQWYKDGVAIPGATSQSYQTIESGTFGVQVDLGSCTVYGTIDLVSELFEANLNVPEANTIEEGESLFVEVSDTATAPEYEWFLNGTQIPNANQNTYYATDSGNYSVVIHETSGCMGYRELFFEVDVAADPFPDVNNIPNIVSPNGDGINDTWVIPTDYVSGSNAEVLIMTNRGEVVLRTNNYQNNWPEDDLNLTNVNQIYYYVITTENNVTKKGTITVIK